MGGFLQALKGPRGLTVVSALAIAGGVAVAGALPAGAGAAAAITVQAAVVAGGGVVQDGLVQGPDGQEWFIVRRSQLLHGARKHRLAITARASTSSKPFHVTLVGARATRKR